MYAVIEDGSRQYRVSEGDVVHLDYRDVDVGAPLELERVLLYQSGQDTRIGRPLVEGARVLAEVVDHPSIKVTIQKFRRRKNYRRFKGHRQPYTAVRIRSIQLKGQPAPAPAKSAEPKQPQATPPAPESAPASGE
jgi:large subunit ribosomal protein L21